MEGHQKLGGTSPPGSYAYASIFILLLEGKVLLENCQYFPHQNLCYTDTISRDFSRGAFSLSCPPKNNFAPLNYPQWTFSHTTCLLSAWLSAFASCSNMEICTSSEPFCNDVATQNPNEPKHYEQYYILPFVVTFVSFSFCILRTSISSFCFSCSNSVISRVFLALISSSS